MATLIGQLPVWIGATLATWAICWTLVSPEACQDSPACAKHLKTYPGYYHIVSTAALLAMAGHEVCGLIATYLGSQQTQALIPHLKSRCLPSFLLALMFGVLACSERLFSRADWTIAHVQPNADGLTAPGRPVYTMQYFEWGINVPILFILSGYCSLGRPLHEVSRPLIVTNIYVIFCWAAAASTSGLLKWMFVFVAFSLFGWASADMLAWVDKFERSAPQDLPSRNIRPWLSNGLIIDFLLYGVVYMSSMLGFIDAQTERKGFFVLTFGSKIAYCAAFVFIRADEYHKTLTDVLRKVSVSNVGMISILRGSFDIILPCVLDAAGRCKLPPQMSGDMEKLEKMLGCRVAGANLKDLLAGEEDKSDFSAYVRNVVRQADCPQGSEVSLSTQGIWTCSAGSMPPIAQVLHSKMMSKTSQARLSATLHLSVVPRSAVSHGKERHLVAAIQFAATMDESKEADTGAAGFETFKADDIQTSTGGSTMPSDTGSAIVANLADLTKLGASAILHASSVHESEEASQYWGPTMVTDDTMSHLGAFAAEKTPGQVGSVPFDARIVGVWEGNTSKALGGYRQRIEFHNDCIHANVTVMGQTMEARFRMNCSVEPCQLDIEVLPKGTSCPPPAIPYIFKFQNGSLHLCGPADNRMHRATNFDGPGLCIMDKIEKNEKMAAPTMPRQTSANTQGSQMSLEPDPEFSRNSTEDSIEKNEKMAAPTMPRQTSANTHGSTMSLEPDLEFSRYSTEDEPIRSPLLKQKEHITPPKQSKSVVHWIEEEEKRLRDSEEEEKRPSQDTILAFQKELLDVVSAPRVQKKLRESRDAGVKCPTLAALLGAKEQRKLLEKYGLDASLSDLKEVTDIWRNFETDPDVYVNHASIQEALGFSTVKNQDLQMPKGSKQPLNKQSLIRLMKSLLKSYSEPDFQAAIEDMKRRADASKEGSKIQKDGYYRLPGREAIAFAVQEQLLPCFGFQATREGVTEMIKRCAEHLEDPEVSQLMDSVNAKLGMSSAACERFRKICKHL